MEDILKNLNKEQLDAVLYNDGPLLLLAGAGTGKTRVLTSKIAYIIKASMAYASQILAVTFTNKAANEMKERVAQMTNLDVCSMWINTFHSIATRILRQHGNLIGINNDFTIIDQGEQSTLIKQIMNNLDIDTKEYNPKHYAEMICKIKDKISSNYDLYRFSEIYNIYQDKLKQLNLCDFGDLLSYNIKLFTEHEDIRQYYNDKFKYILVDEYQDTNAIQHKWLKLISGIDKDKNVKITCVGDDDQSIYGWRGAEIKNILKFTSDYKKAKILKLEKNYRSTQNILNLASNLISNNKDRHQKTLYANNSESNDKVNILKCNDAKQEAIFIVNEIDKLKQAEKIDNYRNTGVLVRAGYQTRIFEDIFLKYSIPYKIIGGLKFYDRKEIKDCIAYLRLVKNKTDMLAFERIVNYPKRGIGSTTVTKIRNFADENNLNMIESCSLLCQNNEIKGKTKDEIEKFLNKIFEWTENAKNTTLNNLMQIILIETNFKMEIEKDLDIESKTKLENIDEFLNTLNDFKSIDEFLEYVSLVNENNDKNIIDAVNIMTIHSAKGLEFDAVFLPNWQEGIFPSPKSIEEKNGIEEERRLAYVAITRAKRCLYISYSKFKYEYGDITATESSRFISELPIDNLNILNIDNDNYYYGAYYKQKNNFKQKYDYRNKYKNDDNIDVETYKSFKQKQIENEEDIKITIYNNKLDIGRKCIHKKFGEGYIKKQDGEKLTILFKEFGEKVIIKRFVEVLE